MKKFLSIVSIMLLMVSFVGCGKKEDKTAEGYAKELNLFIWSEYVSDDAIKGFEDKYGIKVNVSYFTSTDEMNAKLMSGNGKDYDLVQAGNSQVENLINQKYIECFNYLRRN